MYIHIFTLIAILYNIQMFESSLFHRILSAIQSKTQAISRKHPFAVWNILPTFVIIALYINKVRET